MNAHRTPGTVAGSKTSYELQGEREVVMTRVFDAPRDRVFRTFCDPKQIPEWWGPPNVTTTVEAMDVRPGGAWRFGQRGADGHTHVFHGTYREVDAPSRIVTTFEYEGAPGNLIVETYEFLEQGNQTLVKVTSVFGSKGALGGMLQAGMESAGPWPEGTRHQWRLDRLAGLLGRRA